MTEAAITKQDTTLISTSTTTVLKNRKKKENNRDNETMKTTTTVSEITRKSTLTVGTDKSKRDASVGDDVSSPMFRVDHFPHPPQSRESVLANKKNEGFLNLIAILIIGWCVIEMHHTYREKGKYLDFDLLFALLKDFPMHILLWLCIMSFSCISAVTLEYMFEHFERMERGWGEIVMIMLYVSSAASLYIIPPYIALQRDMSPLLRGALAMQICVNAFKLHSYFMTNRYLRKSRKTKPKTYKQLLFGYLDFLRMPTLVYEKNYPRKDRIDIVYVMKETAGMLICFVSMYLVIQKFLMPYIEMGEEIRFYELVYLLGVPTLFLWVIGFYGVFHCMLNVIAELARFEDREFYLDWWSSTSMSEFWRLWNRAVYKFMCRHIYLESMRQVPFFNKWWASVSTFVTTAILHEYVLAVAFGFLRPYFFTMICIQIPFVYFTDHFLKGMRLGNIVMWAGLILGFPLLQLSYTYSYFHKTGHL